MMGSDTFVAMMFGPPSLPAYPALGTVGGRSSGTDRFRTAGHPALAQFGGHFHGGGEGFHGGGHFGGFHGPRAGFDGHGRATLLRRRSRLLSRATVCRTWPHAWFIEPRPFGGPRPFVSFARPAYGYHDQPWNRLSGVGAMADRQRSAVGAAVGLATVALGSLAVVYAPPTYIDAAADLSWRRRPSSSALPAIAPLPFADDRPDPWLPRRARSIVGR